MRRPSQIAGHRRVTTDAPAATARPHRAACSLKSERAPIGTDAASPPCSGFSPEGIVGSAVSGTFSRTGCAPCCGASAEIAGASPVDAVEAAPKNSDAVSCDGAPPRGGFR